MSAVIVSTRLGTSERTRPIEAPAATRLRLTRRGRAVFTVLASLPLVVWTLVAVLGSGDAAADSGAARAATSFAYVTIGQGDSLWALAESLAPQGDPRELVDEIMRLNGLDDAVVEPGQRLALPIVP
jgi:hypothetical protein